MYVLRIRAHYIHVQRYISLSQQWNECALGKRCLPACVPCSEPGRSITSIFQFTYIPVTVTLTLTLNLFTSEMLKFSREAFLGLALVFENSVYMRSAYIYTHVHVYMRITYHAFQVTRALDSGTRGKVSPWGTYSACIGHSPRQVYYNIYIYMYVNIYICVCVCVNIYTYTWGTYSACIGHGPHQVSALAYIHT